MNRSLPSFSTALRAVTAAWVVVLAGEVSAQQGVGNMELLELKTTLETSARQLREMDAQLAAAKVQITTLTQSLAAANADAETARQQYEKLRGVLEGLGIGALEGNRDQVQEKLLAALSDLRLVDDQKRNATDTLMGLTEAVLLYVKNSSDETAKQGLESALAKAESVVRSANGAGAAGQGAGDLHQAKVVSLKPEAALVVLDVGSRDGVRAGMPFTIFRQEQPIAQVMVVDVRRSISGAVIQETAAKGVAPAVGDIGRIDPNQAF
jgi:chromosome segregation ATPase